MGARDGISCGIDFICTAMITGRLVLYHKRVQRIASSSFMPIIIVFIESAALSLIAKILQLGGALTYLDIHELQTKEYRGPLLGISHMSAYAIASDVFIFPLCVSDNVVFIILSDNSFIRPSLRT